MTDKESESEDEKSVSKTIATLKRTRKAFLLEYTCAFFLIGITFLVWMNDISLVSWLQYFVLGFALFSLFSAELSRYMLRYQIMEDKIVIISGLIQQSKKHVFFHPLGFIPDINTKQSRWQRLLNFGTIFVSGGGGNAIEIKDIGKPHSTMELLEELIEINRTPSTMRGNIKKKS